MVQASIAPVEAGQPGPEGASPVGPRLMNQAQPMPVIHSGDRVIVEENSARVEARLGAVALNPAVSGSPLNVRLTIGGNVVRTVALGPGRVAFAPKTVARP
jgi:flagella basal body P-ring formation protein FlgA